MIAFTAYKSRMLLLIFAYLAMFSVAADIIAAIIKRILNKSGKSIGRRFEVLRFLIIVPLICTLLLTGYGYANMQKVVCTSYEITTDKFDANESLKIAFISDVHLGLNMNGAGFSEKLSEIMTHKPDILLLGGDIFDESTTAEDMKMACAALAEKKPHLGIYYVCGNHDLNRYTDTPAFSFRELIDSLIAAGVHVLSDEAIYAIFTDSGTELTSDSSNADVMLFGRPDSSAGERFSLQDIEAYISDVSPDAFSILLDHQPRELAGGSNIGFDLSLSGHTHAGQIFPIDLFNIFISSNDMNYGVRSYGDMTAITSSGMAGWGFPVRTVRHCEYLIINITGI